MDVTHSFFKLKVTELNFVSAQLDQIGEKDEILYFPKPLEAKLCLL